MPGEKTRIAHSRGNGRLLLEDRSVDVRYEISVFQAIVNGVQTRVVHGRLVSPLALLIAAPSLPSQKKRAVLQLHDGLQIQILLAAGGDFEVDDPNTV
jgi:hypothetical protein